MSIASEISRIKNAVLNAYSALERKQASIPQQKTVQNLANTIDSIQNQQVTSDTSMAYPYIVTNGVLSRNDNLDFNDIYIIQEYGLSNQFVKSSYPKFTSGLSFNNLREIHQYGMAGAFNNQVITALNCPELTSVGLSAFDKDSFVNGSTNTLSVINFPKLAIFDNNGIIPKHNISASITISPNISVTNIEGLNSFYSLANTSTTRTFPNISSVEFTFSSDMRDSLLQWDTVASDGSSSFPKFNECISKTSYKQITFNVSSMTRARNYLSGLASCTQLSSLHFPALLSVDGQMFDFTPSLQNTSIKEIYFPEVLSVDNGGLSCFLSSCSQFRHIYLPKLTHIKSYGLRKAFVGTALSSISFPSLLSVGTDALLSAFAQCTALTAIHFKNDASVKQIISSSNGYNNNFGAPNAQILFDL